MTVDKTIITQLIPFIGIGFLLLIIYGILSPLIKKSLNQWIRRFKLWFWILNTSKDCPFCGKMLEEHGFYQEYRCNNPDCNFPKTSEKIREVSK